MTSQFLWRRTARYQLAASLLVVACARWQQDAAAAVAAGQGAGLVAFNLRLGRLLSPLLAGALGQGSAAGGSPRLGRVAAICAGKLALQLGVAAAVMLGHPPAPWPFLAGLSTLGLGLGAAAAHQLPGLWRPPPPSPAAAPAGARRRA